MDYFIDSLNDKENLENYNNIPGFFLTLKPMVGDVLKIYFSKKGSYYFFEGFCFSIFRKKFLSFDTSIKLINKIQGNFIMLSFSFFANLIFHFEKLNYKKTKFSFRRAKISSYKKIIL